MALMCAASATFAAAADEALSRLCSSWEYLLKARRNWVVASREWEVAAKRVSYAVRRRRFSSWMVARMVC